MTPTPNADELLELAPVSGEEPCDPLPPTVCAPNPKPASDSWPLPTVPTRPQGCSHLIHSSPAIFNLA